MTKKYYTRKEVDIFFDDSLVFPTTKEDSFDEVYEITEISDVKGDEMIPDEITLTHHVKGKKSIDYIYKRVDK